MSRGFFLIRNFIVLTFIILFFRLFYLQIINSDYSNLAESNIIKRKTLHPRRGLIFDRKGQVLASNQPLYDIIGNHKLFKDSLKIQKLKSLLSLNSFEKKGSYFSKKHFSIYQSLKRDEFYSISDLVSSYPNIEVVQHPARLYTSNSLAHILGYVGEVSPSFLEKDSSGMYKQGDYIGISGLEARYEKFLKGNKGVKYVMTNASGNVKGSLENGSFDTLSTPGTNLSTTIDLDIQNYAYKLMSGKKGGVVAIEPKTGEILCMVSMPSFDLNKLIGRKRSDYFSEVKADTTAPLFVRPAMATYPPGSIFKPLQALIALQEGVIKNNERIACFNSPMEDHAPFGHYNIVRGIKFSSNTFFYRLFKRVIEKEQKSSPYLTAREGVDKWYNHLKSFGLGDVLGVDISQEKSGFTPSLGTYDKLYGKNRWKFSNIYSLSIGQGELLVTPLQMANMTAAIANKGYYYTPHFLQSPDSILSKEYKIKRLTSIDSTHFEIVIEGMAQVVDGTAWRARIPGIEICGKTGTAQNPQGIDHSVFVAFAPRENPQIAISAYIENAGWGGRAAASIASLIIEKYLLGEIKRKYIEDYTLKGEFLDKKQLAELEKEN